MDSGAYIKGLRAAMTATIKAAGGDREVTQERFGRMLDVTFSTVSRWENGHVEPSKLAWKAIRDLERRFEERSRELGVRFLLPSREDGALLEGPDTLDGDPVMELLPVSAATSRR